MDAVMAAGQFVPTGEGDGEVTQTVSATKADGFDGPFRSSPTSHMQGRWAA
jgi:hypothetical protein